MTGQEVAQVHITDIRTALDKMDSEFKAALPAHIPVERFKRVVMTAVQANPDLISSDRRSLFGACVRCAQDGLYPDGHEAALTTFRDNRAGIVKVQYMPMVVGIIKKARNSGEIDSIGAHVVHKNDSFRYWFDDEGEHVTFEPSFTCDRGDVWLVCAFAKTKNGTLYAEPMTIEEIEKVRNVSRSKSGGPWAQWWSEMARKTAMRRLSKRLPLTPVRGEDLQQVLRRDDSLYDPEQKDVTPVTKELPPPKPERKDFEKSTPSPPAADKAPVEDVPTPIILPTDTSEPPATTAEAQDTTFYGSEDLSTTEGYVLVDRFGDVVDPSRVNTAKAFADGFSKEVADSRTRDEVSSLVEFNIDHLKDLTDMVREDLRNSVANRLEVLKANEAGATTT